MIEFDENRHRDPGDDVIRVGRGIQTRREHAKMLVGNNKTKEHNDIASDLLANLSNDLTEPLSTLITMARDLEKTELTQEQQNLLKSIMAAAGNLRNSLNSAMDYATMEVNKPEVAYHNFHLAVLLEELVALIKPQANAKGIAIRLTIGDHVPDYVFGDKTKIQQVVTHLFDYLINNLNNYNIELFVQAATENPFDNMLTFVFNTDLISDAIKDKQILGKEPVQKTIGENEHMGLGIRMTKALVELMGGELMTGKQPSSSQALSFSIPLMESSAPVLKDDPLPDYKSRKKQLKMLLAEDDVINQMYLAGFLRMQGWEVDTAYNGLTVMELYEPGKYDLIILDGQMPAMDGFETARRIRQIEGSEHHTPILAISGFAIPGDKQKFLDAGMDEYIPKPINEDELLRAIYLLTA